MSIVKWNFNYFDTQISLRPWVLILQVSQAAYPLWDNDKKRKGEEKRKEKKSKQKQSVRAKIIEMSAEIQVDFYWLFSGWLPSWVDWRSNSLASQVACNVITYTHTHKHRHTHKASHSRISHNVEMACIVAFGPFCLILLFWTFDL